MPYLDYRLGRGSRKMPDYASISGHLARCFADFTRVSRVIVICSEFTDCGKSEQELSMLLLLVSSKISSKREMFTTKGFLYFRTIFNYFIR